MIHIDRVEAIAFHKVMTAGRTCPLLLTCAKSDGSSVYAVVKFANGGECTQSSLSAELIASQLAADLGLPTPTPLIVTWEQMFADSFEDEQARKIVAGSSPPAFGSTFVTDGFAIWPAQRKLIGYELRQLALAIYFFDAMIGNSDRRVVKPNILASGDNLRLIDHEMAFQDYRLIVKPPTPWALGGLNSFVTPGAHIFAAQLSKNARELDFGSIRSAWAALSDRQIEAYEASLPPEWSRDRSLTCYAVARVKACRDHIDPCIAECGRTLNAGT